MKEILITEPHLFSTFSCIGNACREHCCAGWKIVFDKKSVNRYINSKNIVIRNIAVDAIQITKKSVENWGHIKRDTETGACPFLDSSRLCSVHGLLGHQALSPTCSTYPRQSRHYQNEIHNNINLSCPQAAEILVTNPDAMLLQQQTNIAAKFQSAPTVDMEAKLLHLFCLNILNSGVGSIEEQLYAIVKFSMLAEKIETINDDSINTLTGYYQQLLADLEAGNLCSEMAGVKARADVKANLIFMLHTYLEKSTTQRGRDVLSRYLQQLKEKCEIDSDAQSVNSASIEVLNSAWDSHCKPWFAEHEYVLRNLIFYKFWQYEYPKKNGRSALTNLYLIVAEYYFLKALITVGAMEQAELNKDILVDIIYSFHSVTQHSPVATENFHRLIAGINLNDDLSLIHLLV